MQGTYRRPVDQVCVCWGTHSCAPAGGPHAHGAAGAGSGDLHQVTPPAGTSLEAASLLGAPP